MRAPGSEPLSSLTCRRELGARPLAQAHQQQLAIVALRAAARYVQLSPQIYLQLADDHAHIGLALRQQLRSFLQAARSRQGLRSGGEYVYVLFVGAGLSVNSTLPWGTMEGSSYLT